MTISRIEDFSLKSFNHYTGPKTEESFIKNNIIFGYNGRGKSTLATGIYNKYINDGNDSNNIRFYDRDYIKNSLVLKNQDGNARIKGVIASFGEKASETEGAINKLKNDIVDIEAINNNLQKAKTALRKDIDSIHERRRGNANIQKKSLSLDVIKVIDLYDKDLKNALKINGNSEKELSKIEGDNLLEDSITKLNTLGLTNTTNTILNTDYEEIKSIFNSTFESVNIPSNNIIEWLNEGLTIHKNDSSKTCHFCGKNIDIDSIEKRITKYNSNIKQKSVVKLKIFKDSVTKIVDELKNNLSKQTLVESMLTNDAILKQFSTLSKEIQNVSTFLDSLGNKIKDICDYTIKYTDISNSLNNAIESNRGIILAINAEINRYKKLLLEKDALVKGAIGLEIKNDSNIQEQIKEIEQLTAQLKRSKASNKEIYEQIEDLRNSKTATSSFAAYISRILREIGVKFEITVDSDGHDYIIKSIDSNNIIGIDDISEGEKNILALIYFYYELFNDDQQSDFKKDIELIILDDPISSLDEINHMYILSLVEQILDLKTPQVFIFTHSWDDFATISYKYKNDDKNRFYEIFKDNNGQSYISKKANIADNPYHHHFREVYSFSKKDNCNNLNDCEIYHIPNVMRQVLEGFLKFKTRNNNASKANEKQIGTILFNENWAKLKESKKTKLSELLLTINIDSHRPTRNPEEVLKSAKFLMDRIEHIDKRHFDTYKEDLG